MALPIDFSPIQAHPYLTIFSLLSTYLVLLTLYRLFLHPLAHIPGPKLAAITQWFEFYYDVLLVGQYQNQFMRWHEKYGPIIRINPNELHCIDPAFIDTIYAGGGSGKKRDKDVFNLNAWQLPYSCFGTVSHDVHRVRRSSVNPFFSRASVAKLEDSIRSYVDRICAHVETYSGTGEPCNLTAAFTCLSTDIITGFSFGWDRGYTANRDFTPNLQQAMLGGMKPCHLFRHLPFLLPIMNTYLPESVIAKLMPDGPEYFRFEKRLYETVDDVLAGKTELKEKEGQRTIYKEILEGKLPEAEKSAERMRHSAREIIGAGTLTTASGRYKSTKDRRKG